MKLLEYLKRTEEELQVYIDSGLIDVAYHAEFPLEMYTYGRKAVHENVWDDVTMKCRGLIVRSDTDEIIARPFEKFFNLGTSGRPETDPANFCALASDDLLFSEPQVIEKMDGFLCTLYEWEGKAYIASKGSFNSMHAKWATAWYRAHEVRTAPFRNTGNNMWPLGYTPVFEGITPNIRIVVDYEGREELVLLALVKKETGEELNQESLKAWAKFNHFSVPHDYKLSWQQASMETLQPRKNFEGYVLMWPRRNETPFRLKVKFVEYLRLHRMVTGTSPKAIFDILSGNGWAGEMDDLLNDSTPWFNAYVSKWKKALEEAYNKILFESQGIFEAVKIKAKASPEFWTRKQWAEEFTQLDVKNYSGVLFGLLDGKDPAPIIWKLVKPMTKNAKPLVDARFV